MTRRLILSACALALAGAVQPAVAQMGPPPGEGPPAEPDARMNENRVQTARDMHVLLRLRPDQEAAWSAYEAALAPPPFKPAPPPETPTAVTTPKRLDDMLVRRNEMVAYMTKLETATRAFYAALTPDQQQAFDAVERLKGPPRMFVARFGPGAPPLPPPPL